MPHAINDEDWPDFEAMLKEFRDRRGAIPHRQQPVRHDFIPRTFRLAILRRPLTQNGIVDAELLEYREDTVGLDIAAFGFHTQSREFELITPNQDGKKSKFHTRMTADEFYESLIQNKFYDENVISVTLGSDPEENVHPMRWRIELNVSSSSQYPGFHNPGNVSFLNTSLTSWHGTGEIIEVSCPLLFSGVYHLPVGSQVVCAHITGAGWCVIAAEPRSITIGHANDDAILPS